MSRKLRDVDLGPMAMPVGEDTQGENWLPPRESASFQDVARLESLLNEDGRRDDWHFELPRIEADKPASGETDHLGSEIERLWVGSGASGVREVRIGLREDILPDTSVRLYESAGRLEIELTAGSSNLAAWLATRLPSLASGIGSRLHRAVRISVIHSSADAVVGTADWAEGVGA